MANILMIEPKYKCKYPPLGLMKISYYHKEFRKDTVWFSKGELPEEISDTVKNQIKKSKYYLNKYGDNLEKHINEINEIIKENKWDRVYVCTLFTFEYEESIKAIDYAKSLVGKENVYTGGILATLMPEKLRKDTGVIVNTGQLTDSIALGYDDKVNIDILTPDYSILDNTEYRYENHDAYYAYTTRGCGMNCGFCAVKTLEPNYNPFISIKDQINTVKELYGEKKDLLLMDNNVLKSPRLKEIIDEIVELGFKRNAKYINPRTGKVKKRFVDFNQGLDAFLMTEEKAQQLGRIAIKPARIAFDHIEDAEAYATAIKRAALNGVNFLSNYLLYNADAFSGKGRKYKADAPEDLYNRLKLNVELQEELNNQIRDEDNKVSIFSFPMRYIPLDNKARGYVGMLWNKKYLRAVQSILIPTQGKGVSGKSFFEAAFGHDLEEFLKVILMPESYIVSRGNPNKIKNISPEDLKNKIEIYKTFERKRNEWRRLYALLDEKEKKNFEAIIGKNKFDYFAFKEINNITSKKLFIHYVTDTGLINLLEAIYLNNDCNLDEIVDYLVSEFNIKYTDLVLYMINNNKMVPKLRIFKYIFKENGTFDLIKTWFEIKCEDNGFIKCFTQAYNVPEEFMYVIKWGVQTSSISLDEIKNIVNYLISNDTVKEIKYFEGILNNVFKYIEGNYNEDAQEIINKIKEQTIFQMSLLV